MWRRLQSFAPILAGTLMIMGVVLLNGGPNVFTDTDDYFVEGRTFAVTIADFVHLHKPPPAPTDPDDIADAKEAAADLHMSHTQIGARSPYYGLLLYSTQRIGTIWLTTLVQAAVGAWLTFLLWRMAAPKARLWTAYAAEAAVAAFSTLPFFAAFTMPDVFGGYTALGEILLLAFWDRMARWERFTVALLVALSLTFHTSQLFSSLGLLVLAFGLYRLFKAPKVMATASMLTVGLAMMAAVFATSAYKEGVKLKTGDELRRPPFLAMRVLADGPGREYLREACKKDPGVYALCAFKQLPLDNSQDLLWSDDRRKGIFNVTTLETRLRMEKEENEFVINAVLAHPFEQVAESTENWFEQLGMYYVDDPIKNPHYYLTNAYWSTTNLPLLLNQAHNCGRDHWGCGFRLSIDGSVWFHGIMLGLGSLLIAWRLTRRDIAAHKTLFSFVAPPVLALGVMADRLWRARFYWLRSTGDPDPAPPFSEVMGGFTIEAPEWQSDAARMAMALILLVAVVLINGFVCGALSGPFPRYQARIVWLITAGGAISVISMLPAIAAERYDTWWPRFSGIPIVAWGLKRVDPAFFRFGLVGVAGFTVDYGVLHTLVSTTVLGPIAARFISFPVAVLATWLLNRTFTFRQPTVHGPLRQALVYAAVQGAGGVANIAVYTAAIALVPMLSQALFIPLAFGSVAGLCLTFLGSKHFAFKAAPALAPAPAADKPADHGDVLETGS